MRTADGYIVHKCLNGDSAAFGLLVERYKEGVYALAYSKLGNFHDAEDVTMVIWTYTRHIAMRMTTSIATTATITTGCTSSSLGQNPTGMA